MFISTFTEMNKFFYSITHVLKTLTKPNFQITFTDPLTLRQNQTIASKPFYLCSKSNNDLRSYTQRVKIVNTTDHFLDTIHQNMENTESKACS